MIVRLGQRRRGSLVWLLRSSAGSAEEVITCAHRVLIDATD